MEHPYIITVRDRYPAYVDSSAPFGRLHSRRAVASLDAAQQAARDELYARIPRAERTETSLGYDREAYWFTVLRGEANDLTEQGGRIGPLPDGTVIEVLQRGWGWLAAQTGHSSAQTSYVNSTRLSESERQFLLDTYNAKEGRPADAATA